MDIRLALMCGSDIPIPECQLILHQPTLKEISFIGSKEYLMGAQTLCVSKKLYEDEKVLADTNNFQIFMMIMSQKETADKKIAVQQTLLLLFPKYKTIFTPRSLIFMGENGESIIIDENNFEFLQEIINKVCCLKSGPAGQSEFNPGGKKAEEIAKKLMRGRQRVAEQKGEADTCIFTQYLSILTIGLNSMSLRACMDLTIFQVYDLVERYKLYVDWDIDIRSRLAGGKPEGQVENWMKNIH